MCTISRLIIIGDLWKFYGKLQVLSEHDSMSRLCGPVVVWSLSCIYNARYLPMVHPHLLCARIFFNNRSRHLVCKVVRVFLSSGPSYAVL